MSDKQTSLSNNPGCPWLDRSRSRLDHRWLGRSRLDHRWLDHRWLDLTCAVLAFVLLLSNAVVVKAEPLLISDPYSKQREQFLDLEKSLRTLPKKRLNKLDREIEELAEYPLYPYLLRLKIERNLSIQNRQDIEQFLERYQGQPVTYGLRYRWLNYLAKRGHESTFLNNYRDGMGAKLTCQALHFRMKHSDEIRRVLADVDALWLHGQSQPDECDPVFEMWQESGFLTSDKVLKRIEIAAKEGNRRIIPYLRKKLPEELQYIANAWLAVTRSYSAVNRSQLFPLKHKEMESNVLTWAIEKLAWKDPGKAVNAYHTYVPRNIFSTPQLHIIKRAIALSFTLDRRPEAEAWLIKADVPGANEDVKLWHVSYLLRTRQWQRALSVIENASEDLQQQENYRYWRARAHELLGHTEQAKELYQQLAGERHYYGFMASARIGRTPNLAHSPVPKNQDAIQAIATMPTTQRAIEFYRLNRPTEARREWRYLLASLPDSQVTYAGILAYDLKLYDQAIISFAKSGYWDDVSRRFPLAFESQFTEKSNAYDVSKAFAMAIARRESSFMVDAVSPAGATGLMQIMPRTAQYLAKQRVSRETLFKVNDNLEYGIQYLRYLMDKLNNNTVLVSASYNAGWRKVLEWLPENQALPIDIWIENIPYKETRQYVKAVLAYQYIYEQQLGESKSIFPHLTQGVIPSSSALTTHPQTGSLQLAPQ